MTEHGRNRFRLMIRFYTIGHREPPISCGPLGFTRFCAVSIRENLFDVVPLKATKKEKRHSDTPRFSGIILKDDKSEDEIPVFLFAEL